MTRRDVSRHEGLVAGAQKSPAATAPARGLRADLGNEAVCDGGERGRLSRH